MTSSDGDRLLRLLCSLDANSVGTLYAFLEATDVEAIAATVGKGFLNGSNGFDARLAERTEALQREPHAGLVLRFLNRVAQTMAVEPRRHASTLDLTDACEEVVRQACRQLRVLDHDFEGDGLDALVDAHRAVLGGRDPGSSSLRRLARAYVAQLPEAQRRVLGVGVGAGDVVGLLVDPLGVVGAVLKVGGTVYNACVHYAPLRQRISIFAVALAAHGPAGVHTGDADAVIESVLRLCDEAAAARQSAEREVELAAARVAEERARLDGAIATREATQETRQLAARRLGERRAALAEHCRARVDEIAEGLWGPALAGAGQVLRASRDQLRRLEAARPDAQTGFFARVAGSARQWVESALVKQTLQTNIESVLQAIEANDWARTAPIDAVSRRFIADVAAQAEACVRLDHDLRTLGAEIAHIRQQLAEATERVSRTAAARVEITRRYADVQPAGLAAVPA